MEAVVGLVILFIVGGLVLGGLAGLIRKAKSRPSSTAIDPNWQPPKADRLPYKKKNYLFSTAERSFYEVARSVLPDHTIFAKVRLADLMYVQKGSDAFYTHFNRISAKHVDFVVCNKNMAPVFVIELDDASHDSEDRKDRDAFVDQALAAAEIPVLRVRAKRGYVLDELRALLLPHVLPIPTVTGTQKSSTTPPPLSDERYMPPET
jgi:very-short-patch-repair endonuclease